MNIFSASRPYNEAGLLKTKYLHSQGGLVAFMQKIEYKYNIRGWLTAINEPVTEFTGGDRFGMRLWYNKKPDGSAGFLLGNTGTNLSPKSINCFCWT